MRRRFRAGLVVSALLANACAATGDNHPLPTDGDAEDRKQTRKPAGTEIEGSFTPGVDPITGETKPADPSRPGAYAHSGDTLYALELSGRKATKVGKFSCLTGSEQVYDIAVDANGNVFATTTTHFISVDPQTAGCRIIGEAPADEYPNSLSFVPAGTLDPSKEVLVGYGYHEVQGIRDNYVRIDTTTGKMTFVGTLNLAGADPEWESSGDLIALSNEGNKAYLTVTPRTGLGTDRLAEINPKTGQIIRIVGDTGQTQFFGLTYWAGKAYGFSGSGGIFSIELATGKASPANLAGADAQSWYGAGITTSAPTK
jgi:hypothetical protein